MKGAKWAKEHHFDTPGKLPDHVPKKKSKKKSKKNGKKKSAGGYGRGHH